MKLGLISDTHNYLDPEVPRLFQGVDHILHGGDVGLPKILQALEEIAPVTAVLGNTDDPAFGYRLTELAELGGRRFLLHHIVNPRAVDEGLKETIARERPHAIIFGHTHKPFAEVIDNTWFINPGYAGKPRFGLQRSVALLRVEGSKLIPQFFVLG